MQLAPSDPSPEGWEGPMGDSMDAGKEHQQTQVMPFPAAPGGQATTSPRAHRNPAPPGQDSLVLLRTECGDPIIQGPTGIQDTAFS